MRRYALRMNVSVIVTNNIDETGTSSYCWQNHHLRRREKVEKVAPFLDKEKADRKGIYFSKDVKTSNCHRLRQCTGICLLFFFFISFLLFSFSRTRVLETH